MVKGYHKCSFPIGVDDKKKRGERDPVLKVTDNSSSHQLGLYSVNWCLCFGYWLSKWKSKFLMPATVVFSGNTVNTGSAFKALSALTVNFLITLRGWPFNSWGEGGGWVISGRQELFFLAIWWAGYFFPSKCSTGYFFPSSFLCRIFFSSKKGHVFTYTKCIYTYIVVIAVIVLIWSCKALKCCKLYKIIIV